MYDISILDYIQAELILNDAISIVTTSGGIDPNWHVVVTLRENGEYAVDEVDEE